MFILNNFLNLKLFLDGESSSLLNNSLNLLINNKLNYELADILKYAGLNTFSMHPPLYYFLNYILFNFINVYPKTIFTLNLILTILFFLIFFSLNLRINKTTKISIIFVAILICLQQQIFFRNLISFRPEMLLGFINFILVILLSLSYKNIFTNICIGFLLVLAISSHWLGFFSLFICGILLLSRINILHNKSEFFKCNFYVFTSFFLTILLWDYFYDNQLLQHFVLSYKYNLLNLQIIPHTFINNFIFKVFKNEGIILFLIGIIIQIYFLFFKKDFLFKDNFFSRLLKNLNIFFIIFIFLMIYMGNKEDRYFINIFFIGLFLSSIGYMLLFKYLFINKKNTHIFIISLIITYNSFNNKLVNYHFEKKDENNLANFEIIRESLNFLENKKVLIGSTSYPFTYDRNIYSTFNIVYKIFDQKLNQTDIRENRGNIEYYLKLYEHLKSNIWELKEEEIKKEILEQEYQYLMISPICYWYQCLFYRSNVWSDSFDKSITILRLRQSDFLEKIKGNIPYIYSVYKKKNNLNIIDKTEKTKVICTDKFVLFKHKGDYKEFNQDFKEWSLLKPSKRKKIILEILKSYNFKNISDESLIEIEEYIYKSFSNPILKVTKTRYRDSLTVSQLIENILQELIKNKLKNNFTC